jgi:hypothetical protein
MRSFARELSVAEVSQLIGFLTGKAVDVRSITSGAWRSDNAHQNRPGRNAQGGNTKDEQVAVVARGKLIFFDLTRENRCSACHTYYGRGGTVAVDLTNAALCFSFA